MWRSFQHYRCMRSGHLEVSEIDCCVSSFHLMSIVFLCRKGLGRVRVWTSSLTTSQRGRAVGFPWWNRNIYVHPPASDVRTRPYAGWYRRREENNPGKRPQRVRPTVVPICTRHEEASCLLPCLTCYYMFPVLIYFGVGFTCYYISE